jgi:hypothetical protein
VYWESGERFMANLGWLRKKRGKVAFRRNRCKPPSRTLGARKCEISGKKPKVSDRRHFWVGHAPLFLRKYGNQERYEAGLGM